MSLLRNPTRRYTTADDDLQRPSGYRFLVQSREFWTEGEFRDWLLATFGPRKALFAVVVRGFRETGIQRPTKFKATIKSEFRAYIRK